MRLRTFVLTKIKIMRLTLLLTFFLISGVSTAQIKVSRKKDVDFSKYKTFVVQKGQVVSLLREQKANEKKVFQAVQSTVNRELTLQGYQMADDSTAQLIISYVFEEADRSTDQKSGPLGQTPISDPSNIDAVDHSASVITRTLIIEIEDTRKNSLWTATCSLSRSQRDLYDLIDMTVVSAFRKFSKKSKKNK